MMSSDIELNTRESQQAALEVFKVVESICRSEGLTYYLAYGTLIGAIRHEGFIPWDDDLDILMPRPDYNALIRYFVEHECELRPLKLIQNSETRSVPFLIARVTDTRYRQIGESALDVPEMGAFIDVYPLDGLGNDRQRAIEEKRRCYALVLAYLKAGNFNMNNRGNGAFKRLLKSIRALTMKRPSFYESQIMRGADEETYRQSDYVSCKCWMVPSIVDMVHKKADFGDGVPVMFEGMRVTAPANYDAVLRRQYGDYMQLPPIEQRVGHHEYGLVLRA